MDDQQEPTRLALLRRLDDEPPLAPATHQSAIRATQQPENPSNTQGNQAEPIYNPQPRINILPPLRRQPPSPPPPLLSTSPEPLLPPPTDNNLPLGSTSSFEAQSRATSLRQYLTRRRARGISAAPPGDLTDWRTLQALSSDEIMVEIRRLERNGVGGANELPSPSSLWIDEEEEVEGDAEEQLFISSLRAGSSSRARRSRRRGAEVGEEVLDQLLGEGEETRRRIAAETMEGGSASGRGNGARTSASEALLGSWQDWGGERPMDLIVPGEEEDELTGIWGGNWGPAPGGRRGDSGPTPRLPSIRSRLIGEDPVDDEEVGEDGERRPSPALLEWRRRQRIAVLRRRREEVAMIGGNWEDDPELRFGVGEGEDAVATAGRNARGTTGRLWRNTPIDIQPPTYQSFTDALADRSPRNNRTNGPLRPWHDLSSLVPNNNDSNSSNNNNNNTDDRRPIESTSATQLFGYETDSSSDDDHPPSVRVSDIISGLYPGNNVSGGDGGPMRNPFRRAGGATRNGTTGHIARGKQEVVLLYCGGPKSKEDLPKGWYWEGGGGDEVGGGCGTLICARGLLGVPGKVFDFDESEDGGGMEEEESVASDLPPCSERVGDVVGGPEKVGDRGVLGCRGCSTKDVACRACGNLLGFRLLRPCGPCSTIPRATLTDGMLWNYRLASVTIRPRLHGVRPPLSLSDNPCPDSDDDESIAPPTPLARVERQSRNRFSIPENSEATTKPLIGSKLKWINIPHPQIDFEDSLIAEPSQWLTPDTCENWWLENGISRHCLPRPPLPNPNPNPVRHNPSPSRFPGVDIPTRVIPGVAPTPPFFTFIPDDIPSTTSGRGGGGGSNNIFSPSRISLARSHAIRLSGSGIRAERESEEEGDGDGGGRRRVRPRLGDPSSVDERLDRSIENAGYGSGFVGSRSREREESEEVEERRVRRVQVGR